MVVLEYVELQEPTNGNQSKIDAFQLNPSGYRTPQKYYCSSNDSAEHFTSIPADQQKIQKKKHQHAFTDTLGYVEKIMTSQHLDPT